MSAAVIGGLKQLGVGDSINFLCPIIVAALVVLVPVPVTLLHITVVDWSLKRLRLRYDQLKEQMDQTTDELHRSHYEEQLSAISDRRKQLGMLWTNLVSSAPLSRSHQTDKFDDVITGSERKAKPGPRAVPEARARSSGEARKAESEPDGGAPANKT